MDKVDLAGGQLCSPTILTILWNTAYGCPSNRAEQRLLVGLVGRAAESDRTSRQVDAGYGRGDAMVMDDVCHRDALGISSAQAQEVAQDWLNQHYYRASAGVPRRYPGYYTTHVRRDGAVIGLLSIHGQTGLLWYHTWHAPLAATERLPDVTTDRKVAHR